MQNAGRSLVVLVYRRGYSRVGSVHGYSRGCPKCKLCRASDLICECVNVSLGYQTLQYLPLYCTPLPDNQLDLNDITLNLQPPPGGELKPWQFDGNRCSHPWCQYAHDIREAVGLLRLFCSYHNHEHVAHRFVPYNSCATNQDLCAVEVWALNEKDWDSIWLNVKRYCFSQ